MKVIATATGFDGLVVRSEGDTFDMDIPDDTFDEKVYPKAKQPTWFKPVPRAAKGDKQVKDVDKAADFT